MTYEEQIGELQKIVDTHQRIVFFGGAGVSTESGIPDFRSQDGLYHQQYAYPPETIISHSFFLQNTEEFYRFYKDKMLILDVEPNPAHRKLAELERAGKLKAVVTQNIDGLHQKAGSRRVYELHGSIHRNHCLRCGKFFDAAYVKAAPGVPRCDECGGLVKPDVVLYEEGLDQACVEGAVNAIRRHVSGGLSCRGPHRLFPGRPDGSDQQVGDLKGQKRGSCDFRADRRGSLEDTGEMNRRDSRCKSVRSYSCQKRKRMVYLTPVRVLTVPCLPPEAEGQRP